jgi:hypothetical protein
VHRPTSTVTHSPPVGVSHCHRHTTNAVADVFPSRRQVMSTGTDISALYREFTDALTEVLAENAVGPARRGRLARARAAVKKHRDYSEHAYFLAVESAFTNWEAMQNVGR